MRARRFLLPIAALALVGCDRITGADQQKALDAEAIGYSCRISLKLPEDCMKENDTHNPTSILYGWKEADRDVSEKNIDPSMGKNQPATQVQSGTQPVAATEGAAATGTATGNAAASKNEKPATTAGEKTTTSKNGKPDTAVDEKPAAATAKPDKGAAEAKPVR